MFDNTKEPLYADFNGADSDGAVWMMGPPFKNMHLDDTDFTPTEGARVWISDGDVEERGILGLRKSPINEHEYWVSITEKDSIKDVPKDVWYHSDNLENHAK